MTFTACHFGGNDMETTERTKFCKHCGAKANNGDIICFVCGKKLLYGGADESDEI